MSTLQRGEITFFGMELFVKGIGWLMVWLTVPIWGPFWCLGKMAILIGKEPL